MQPILPIKNLGPLGPFLIALTIVLAIATPSHAAETIPLFNGENLDHFYTFLKDRGRDTDPKNVFTIRDNILVISGEEWGCITTKEEFENYHLILEYTWSGPTHEPRIDRARDSGVLVHSQGPDGAYSGTWMHAIEVQIIEGGTGDFIVVNDGSPDFAVTAPSAPEKQGSSHLFDPNGQPVTINSGRINWWGRDPEWKDEINFRGKQDIERPPGEWNRLECIVVGQTITVILNGKLVNQAINVQPRKGRIQIQSEGAEIQFRKIDLTPLTD